MEKLNPLKQDSFAFQSYVVFMGKDIKEILLMKVLNKQKMSLNLFLMNGHSYQEEMINISQQSQFIIFSN